MLAISNTSILIAIRIPALNEQGPSFNEVLSATGFLIALRGFIDNVFWKSPSS